MSTDAKGFIEYWCASTYGSPARPTVSFDTKLDTDLFELAKVRGRAWMLAKAACLHHTELRGTSQTELHGGAWAEVHA